MVSSNTKIPPKTQHRHYPPEAKAKTTNSQKPHNHQKIPQPINNTTIGDYIKHVVKDYCENDLKKNSIEVCENSSKKNLNQNDDNNQNSTPHSIFFFNSPRDVFARCCFTGIFIVENIFHSIYFDQEIDALVAPALNPLPKELAISLHTMHIILGMLGACFVILSGCDTAGRTALRKGCSMMLIFMYIFFKKMLCLKCTCGNCA